MGIIKNIIGFISRLSPKHRKRVSNITKDYQKLINEYKLIQEKKSNLSRSEREMIVMRINHLVSKGHLKVNNANK